MSQHMSWSLFCSLDVVVDVPICLKILVKSSEKGQNIVRPNVLLTSSLNFYNYVDAGPVLRISHLVAK